MKNLKRLGLCVTLLCVMGPVAFAGETNSPACAPPDPGTTNTPPCAVGQAAPANDASGQNSASPASNPTEAWVSEVAIDLIESVLSIY